jgi:hypothetical protein
MIEGMTVKEGKQEGEKQKRWVGCPPRLSGAGSPEKLHL